MADENRMTIMQRQVVYDADDYTSRDTLQAALKPELDRQQERIGELEGLKKTQGFRCQGDERGSGPAKTNLGMPA